MPPKGASKAKPGPGPNPKKATPPVAKARFSREELKEYKAGSLLTAKGIQKFKELQASGWGRKRLSKAFGMGLGSALYWMGIDSKVALERGADRPRVTTRVAHKRTPYLKRKVISVVRSFQRANETPSVAEVIRHVNARLASVATVRRMIHELCPVAPTHKVVAMTDAQKKARLDFCDKYKSWTVQK
jgi:sulfur relay (sulfurtransferase) DsrC/TusE family protein